MHLKIALYEIVDHMGIKGLFKFAPGQNRIIKFTGASGAGKTSLLTGMKWLLDGLSSIPGLPGFKKPIHNGAGRTAGLIDLDLVDKDGSKQLARYTIKRGLSASKGRGAMDDGTAIIIDNASGRKMDGKPEEILDALFTQFDKTNKYRNKRTKLSFDPTVFVSLESESQVQFLLELMGEDPEKDRELDAADETARKTLNSELKLLEGRRVELAQTSYEGLPDKPLDIAAIQKKKDQAGAENQRQFEIQNVKDALGAKVARIGVDKMANLHFIGSQKEKIAELERQLKMANDGLTAAMLQDKELAKNHAAAEKEFQQAPEARMVNVAELELEISRANATNQAIERRARFDAMVKELKEKQAASDKLSDGIAQRKRQVEQRIKDNKLPVDGLELKTEARGDSQVVRRWVEYKGLPLANLSEGEQICVAAEIVMAANPKLHSMFIARGESIDEKGHQRLLDLAVKYDFQIWMAVLDTSDTEGLYLFEGTLQTNHYEKPKEPVTIAGAKPKAAGRKKK